MNTKHSGRTLAYDVLPGDICKVNQVAYNQARASDEKGQKHRSRGLTRDTRATVMQALDGRTMLMLERAKKRGVFSNMYGTISTGKEANVYRGTTFFSDLKLYGSELFTRNCLSQEDLDVLDEIENFTKLNYINRAIKVFKTSVLTFKDRSKYVEGEFRFRRGYLKSKNPRKMVTQWCEKEFRNLKRIVISGLRCPIPIYIKKHIFVMSYIGDGSNLENFSKDFEKYDGEIKHDINNNAENAAPRLKDVPISLGRKNWIRIYIEMIGIMHVMFNKCHLIHGDMSEYNTLFYKGHVYVIDVSQSMEHDHPLGLEFLKRDCINVTIFFNKVLQSRKNQENSDCVNNLNENDVDDEISILNDLLSNLNIYSTNIILSPSELYNLITLMKSNDLVEFYEELISSSDDELVSNVKRIVLNILENDNLTWPNFDGDEREYELKCSYLNSQKVIIMKNSFDNQKVFLSILFFTVYHLLSNGKYYNAKFKNFNSIINTNFEDSKNKEGNNIFLKTWTPLHLNQIMDRKTLENELERKECGQELLYGHFICDNDMNNYFSCSESDEESECKCEQVVVLKNDNIYIKNNCLEMESSTNNSVEEDLYECSENEQTDRELRSDQSVQEQQIPKQFNGKIPDNITKKEWKHIVKQENREKRLKKVPKHIKKKKKKKQSK
ncbi:protein with RIO domain [Cryptosporidium sp. chipmunk genotype I]|uniref:protein with RIO domain n=1 Tax=Cryptosporidium sp. chipmunk genotype I TaxID=1280935 RepID=UPI00351AA814|nr:protein with RIO domain [Cryptosporidium sp. chipmunk genotype I]